MPGDTAARASPSAKLPRWELLRALERVAPRFTLGDALLQLPDYAGTADELRAAIAIFSELKAQCIALRCMFFDAPEDLPVEAADAGEQEAAHIATAAAAAARAAAALPVGMAVVLQR